MIPPDREIYEVEKRIVGRRRRVEEALRYTGRQTLRALSSPWALGAAGALGFLLARRVHGRRRGEAAHAAAPATKKAAKASTLSSIAMATATWLIKSQFGSPLEMAQYFLSKMKAGKAPARAPESHVPDRARPRRREPTTAG